MKNKIAIKGKIGSYISTFEKALTGAVANILEASNAYVMAIDADPNAAKLFHEQFEDVVPPSAWAGFEAVGRKQMHPKMLYGGGKNGHYIKRLPYSEQELVFNGERVTMLTRDGKDSILVDLREVTKEQAEQLVSNNHIRTPEEQRSYLEQYRKADEKQPVFRPPYKVGKQGLVISQPCTLTKRELSRILGEM